MLRTKRQLERSGIRVLRFTYPPVYTPLFDALQRPAPRGAKPRRKRPLMDFLEYVGQRHP